MHSKITTKMIQRSLSICFSYSLGAPLAPQSVYETKGTPDVLQKSPQGCQSAPKVLPKYPKRAPKVMTNPRSYKGQVNNFNS